MSEQGHFAESGPPLVGVDIHLKHEGFELSARVAVPRGPIPRTELVPLARSLSNAVVARVEKSLADKGQVVSCKPGCTACCRHLVPLARVEAHSLAATVKALPEPRRSQVLARFAETVRRLEESGLAERLRNRDALDDRQFLQLSLDYHRLLLDCPFLEDDLCTIYAERPLVCREHFVLSPPENCQPGAAGPVTKVELPLLMMPALARLDPPTPGAFMIPTVPLPLVMEWAEANPDEPPARPGPEWLQEFFQSLYRQTNADNVEDNDTDDGENSRADSMSV